MPTSSAKQYLAGIEINDEFKTAFDAIERSSQSMFITGKAGTGKSTLLRYVKEHTKKAAVVLAPTGIAAINVNGQTIHSFFKFPPKFIDTRVIRKLRKRTLIKNLEMIIIDEVSMVRADLMDGIDHALRINRGFDIPFGGVQVVMFGDLFQLPPVVRGRQLNEFFRMHYGSPYFFDAKVFEAVHLDMFELTKVYRQHDAAFVALLERIRNKTISNQDIALLNEKVAHNAIDASDQVITLASTNEIAAGVNAAHLKKIETEEYNFVAQVGEGFNQSEFPAEFDLKLKSGAQIMMLVNDPKGRWVNGTIAQIAEIYDDCVHVRINGVSFEVGMATWSKIEYRYDKEKNTIYEEVVGTFMQYPIKLAWAITIHKSQGKTFDKVIIDMGRGAFAHGQVYVALSRCRCLSDITLKRPIRRHDIIFDQHIYDFRQRFLR